MCWLIVIIMIDHVYPPATVKCFTTLSRPFLTATSEAVVFLIIFTEQEMEAQRSQHSLPKVTGPFCDSARTTERGLTDANPRHSKSHLRGRGVLNKARPEL